MHNTHGLDDLLFDLWGALDVELSQEMVSYWNEGVPWPALEPIHCAARDQSWKFQWSSTELLSNL